MCKECGCGENGTQRQIFDVVGMTCGNCVAAVEKGILALPGVLAATVSLEEKQATVDYKVSEINAEQIVAAIEALGFDASIGAVVSVPHSHGIFHAITKLFK